MRKRSLVIWVLLILLILILVPTENLEPIKKYYSKELLHIIATKYNNGKDDNDGVSIVLYEYSVEEEKIIDCIELSEVALYPVATRDYTNNRIYFSGSENGLYDNLYEYNLKTKKINQLTDGKFLFNDMFMIDGQLFVTVAAEFKTVNQPARYDYTSNKFYYLNEEDDDTWFNSFSYNHSTKKLLNLTTSDSLMRTERVTGETHIRPKKIFLMDPNFKNVEYIYETEEFEIRLTRQLDENRILMTFDPYMGSREPRGMKILYIDTKTVEDIDIPHIKEVYSFYPRNNNEGLFILGRDIENNFGLYYYSTINESVIDILDNYTFPEGHRSIVDFVYTIS